MPLVKTIKLLSDAVFKGQRLPEFTEEVVKVEPMFFNATPAFCAEHGGPITKAFIRVLTAGGAEVPKVVDTRVHMLMPGWYPCIPGWHHDDVPRSRADGQPDYETPAYEARHALCLINGEVAPTEFALGYAEFPLIGRGEGNVYKHWHDHTERLLREGALRRTSAPSGSIVHFDCYSMHRGVPAVAFGWRWFGRASYQTGREPTNEIRKQVQVYLQDPTAGW